MLIWLKQSVIDKAIDHLDRFQLVKIVIAIEFIHSLKEGINCAQKFFEKYYIRFWHKLSPVLLHICQQYNNQHVLNYMGNCLVKKKWHDRNLKQRPIV